MEALIVLQVSSRWQVAVVVTVTCLTEPSVDSRGGQLCLLWQTDGLTPT